MSDNTPNPPQKSEVVETTWLKPSLFGGRFTRKQYFWRVFLASIILGILSNILQAILLTPPTWEEIMRNPSSIESLQQQAMQVNLIINIPASIFFYLPFCIKRAHDIGHKGTFITTLLIIGLISQVLVAVSYDLIALAVLVGIPGLIYGLILLFKDSEKGTNAYGTSTKYPDTTV